MRNYKFAKLAYDAYCKARGWKSIRGEPLPQFEAQAQELQDAWWEAAAAVSSEIAIEAGKG